MEHKGYETKSRVICMDCGERFSPELVQRRRATCPHCGTGLTIEKSQKRTDKQRVYFAYAQIVGDFQVIRNFELYAYYGSGEQARYSCCEILQHWIREDGKREVVARNHTTSFYCDSWNGNMEIRNRDYKGRYYHSANKYDVYPFKYHPDSTFKDIYRKYGIDKNLQELTALEAIFFIPMNNQAETLLKAKQYGFLGFSHSNPGDIRRYWPSIRICIRNKYKVKDASMWIDYMGLLSYFGKDTRNAFYVCPKDLKKAHDRLVIKKRQEEKRQELIRLREKIDKEQLEYEKHKAKFFDLQFKDQNIVVVPLVSVEEFMNEGDQLRHCVFANEYYKKRDSLILSARIDNKPIETVEVSLKKLSVIQARGLSNNPTQYHDQIVDLVNRNIHKIAQRV
ncbi:PcfJ domain-containing protein [Gaoshiqia sediminis]|uniref:PcfJ domain-containing protein n=1 Tax=Gaoshiqia sediminis TaxID=2986998 RepID=A0AA41YCS3_9BACT|nr:PcfJ domain-containing protein [Gaoshiqia sediminis]MCW0484045.1 PcfJ domain-containing protein [Gaoshiqia sediminis]